MGEGVLGRAERVSSRRVHHDDTLFARRFGVDVFVAHAGAADDFELLRGLEHFGGDFGRRADGQTVVIADDLQQLFFRFL